MTAAIPWGHVLIVSRRPLADAELVAVEDRAVPTLPFAVGARLRWRSDDATVALLAFAGTGQVDPGASWHVTPAGVTAFSGLPVPLRGWWHGRASWAEQLDALAGRRSTDDVARDLFGVFGMVRVAADGTGSMGGDELGVSVLYRADGTDRVAVASRVSLARVAADPAAGSSPDVASLGWLLSFDNLVGCGTGDTGVVALPARSVVEIGPDRAVSVRPSALPSDPPAGVDPAELVATDVTTRLGVLAGAPGTPRLGLTGGYDSRVLLALACAAGIADRFRWTTWDLAAEDVVIARRLAAECALDHEVVAVERRLWPGGVDDLVARSGGLLPATEVGALGSSPGLVVSGIGGELLGTYYGAQRTIRRLDDARSTLVDRVRRPQGDTILRPDAVDGYARRLDALVDELAERYRPDMVPTMVYLDHRLHRWQGTVRECGERTDVAPLLAPAALIAAGRLSHEERRHHVLHTRVIANARAALTTVPYARSPASNVISPESWRATAAVLRNELVGRGDGPLSEIVDDGLLRTIVDSGRPPGGHVLRQLVVAHGLARWLAGGG